MSDKTKDIQLSDNNQTKEIFEYSSSFFDKRQSSIHYFVQKKTEKICTALFLITDFLPPSDPFRTTLRSKGLTLLEKSHTLSFFSISLQQAELAACLDELSALFRVGQMARMISDMNASILIEECQTLTIRIKEYGDTPTPSVGDLPQALFEVISQKEFPVQSHQEKGHIKDVMRDQVDNTERAGSLTYDKRQNTLGDKKGHSKSENRDKQRDRRAIILSVLQKKERISVKDVGQVITDCSEKTLQRELLGLVAVGVLKKEGERRWSTYSLAG